MTKTYLKDVDDGTFAQWGTGIRNTLIKEEEWKVVSGRHIRPYAPRKDDTPTVINPPGDSTDPLVYNLGDKTVAAALTLRDEWDDSAKSANATIQLSLSPKAVYSRCAPRRLLCT